MTSESVDIIFKFVEELENQGSLRLNSENQIGTLKFGLRYVRMHFKRNKEDKTIRSWIENVEKCLLQSTRNESMAADFSEETLSNLLLSMKAILREKCSSYYKDGHRGPDLITCKDVLIDELLLEYVDPLLENLKHLIPCNDLYMLVFPKEQIEVLMEKLKSLRNILDIIGAELVKNVKPAQDLLNKTSDDLLTRIKRLIENAIYVSCYSWAEGKQKRMEKLFFDLRVKINHIEPEIRMICVQLLRTSKIPNPGTFGIDLEALAAVDFLLENLQMLLKEQDVRSCILLDIRQIEILYQELSFLKYFLMDPNLKQYSETRSESFSSLLRQVEAVASKGASLTCSNGDGQSNDHTTDELIQLNSDMLKIVNLLKIEIRNVYARVPKPTISGFPQTPTFGFVEFFLQRLDELLKHRAESIAYVKKDIEKVCTNLSFFLNKTYDEDVDIAKRVVNVAYEAERVIDLIVASNLPNWYYILWLSDVTKNMDMLREDYTELCSKKTCGTSVFKVEKAFTRDPIQLYSLVAEEEIVGFEAEAEKIRILLTRGSEQLDIISIVGMAGLGKTTLAQKVYDDPEIRRHFHVRSWYYISQVYDKRDLLLSILGNVTEINEKIRKMNDEDIAETLCKSLRGRKYLIVIDDIWSIEPWYDMRESFPDDFNGSRILFTSRIRKVALQAHPRSNDPLDLSLLSDEESWYFLQNKIFKKRSCPPKLGKIGKQIAKNCEGLPLSLVVIAGVLKRLEESEEHWKQVSESLGKQVVGDSSKNTKILELSYKHLPTHLKPCFLYLGAFPEDKVIQTWKLLRLWIAEGFVQQTENQSLECVAEGYLVDLIGRSLVLIAQKKSYGGVKSCRVHDLLREFSLNKARHENFLLVSKEMVNPEQYRRCFYCKKDSLDGWMPYDPYVRSVFFFPTDRPFTFFFDRYPIDPSILPYIMKLLRVLDLERVPLRKPEFPTEIEVLVHLRYLAIQGRLNCVPSSIGNLWRLETLLIKGMKGEVRLPDALFEMAYLKHVYVDGRVVFELADTFEPEKCVDSDGIEQLSTPKLCHGDGTTEKIIKRLRNLRKLKCIFLESSEYNGVSNQFPVLELLCKLESLNVTYRGHLRMQNPCEISFPTNLQKLTLSNFRLPWSEISKVGRLRQLKVLKLLSRAFEGGRWDVSDEEFCNLKFLKLESLDIIEWDASPDAFLCLQQLVLQKCKRLVEVPSSFGESNTLEVIKVHGTSYSATKSVCEIQKQQQDLRPDGLKVIIDWDSASAS